MTPRPATGYRPAFDCLWCGAAWTSRGPNDLEGWAQLCPTCLGRAGANPFLRGRLRRALAARVGAGQATSTAAMAVARGALGSGGAGHGPASPPPAPRPTAAAFPDDWFLRRGPFERGAIHDAAWAAELDMVTRWLDAQPLAGRIVEPAAGVGFFSPLLAGRGELFAFDADGEALAQARQRLVAHRLRAHLHVAEPWAAYPAAADPGPADALVVMFLLGRVRGAGLDAALAALRERLRVGGRLALADLRPDAAGGPPPGIPWTWHEPAALEAALLRAGFAEVDLVVTGRFFVTVAGTAG